MFRIFRNKLNILLSLLLATVMASGVSAQSAKSRKPQAARQATSQPAKKNSAKKSVSQKKPVNGKTGKKSGQKGKKPVYTNESIRGLEKERSNVQKQIKEQERRLQANKADVKQRLNDLLVINSEIDQHQKSIDGIQSDIHNIDGNISLLNAQLSTLEQQLQDRKQKYIKSMRYMARSRTIQDKLMFVFSAKNLAQMYRRMRFVREYASYQKAQGEMVRAKQGQITDKHKQLQSVKGEKNNLLAKGQREKTALEGKQNEQKTVVASLQKEQKSIQAIIDEQRKKNAQINAQIDRLVAEEVAKAKARAEAEAKRKAAAAAAEKKRKAEELARKKAAAEAAARENARRVQEAKEREARLKAEARAAAERKNEEERRKAEAAARQAEVDREAAERKAAVDKKRREQEVEQAKKESVAVATVSSEDQRQNRTFESNRGRLPMPASGRIITHFGQYNVEGLKNVVLDNSGINIQTAPGAGVRCVFDGEVSGVFGGESQKVVMVRHGNYISVYGNLASVGVHVGQKVAKGQGLGSVNNGRILQFRIYKGSAKLNPEGWLAR